MRHRLLMFVIIALGALLQMLLPSLPLFGGMKPPILAALVLHYSLRRNNRDMWIAVFTAAVMQDGLEPGSFGPALMAFPIIGILSHRIRNEIFADYRLRIASVIRDYGMRDRAQAPDDSKAVHEQF